MIYFYVYEPKKTRPKSQRHGEHLYGPFESEVQANNWREYKGIMNGEIVHFERKLIASNVHEIKENEK